MFRVQAKRKLYIYQVLVGDPFPERSLDPHACMPVSTPHSPPVASTEFLYPETNHTHQEGEKEGSKEARMEGT